MSKERSSRNVSFTDESQYFELIRSGDVKNFKSFLQINATYATRVNVLRTYKGRLALHLASHLNLLLILQYLVEDMNADINLYDDENNNALHLACMSNKGFSHFAIIQYLLSNGIRLDHLNDQMKLPVDYIKEKAICKTIETEMEKLNLDPNKIRNFEKILLKDWIQQWRMTGKTNHWIIDEEKRVTMLHFVAARRYFDILKEITRCPGVDLNPVDIYGSTPMDILKEYHHEKEIDNYSDNCCGLL